MRLALFAQNDTVRVEAINHLALLIDAQVAGLDVLLGVVPCAAAIVQEGCDDDTAHRTNHQQACFGLGAKNSPNGNGGQHGYHAR